MSDRVPYEDVDDVIEAAVKAHDATVDTLSVEELEQVATELDIPAALVAPAVVAVRERRAELLAAELEADRVAARRIRIAAIAATVLVVLGTMWCLIVRTRVRGAWLQVQRQRAQVVNVMQRQTQTRAQWAAAPDSANKHAELSGAQNRVRVERKRYDDAVAEYRAHSSSLAGRLVTTLGDYPDEVPMSSEVAGW